MRSAARTRVRSADAPRPVQPGDRIALYVPSLRGGGAERSMLKLASAIASRDLQVDMVLPQAEGPYLGEVPESVRVVDLRAGRVLRSLPPLVRYLRQERPRGLISAMTHANIVALWARDLARVPTAVVVSERGVPGSGGQRSNSAGAKLFRGLARLFYPRAEAVVAVSSGVADAVAVTTGFGRERIDVIYNPIVTDDLFQQSQEAADHPWFRPGEPPVVLTAGRLVGIKDHSMLIRAFAAMADRRPARLVILGEGEKRRELEALVYEHGLTDRVALPGFAANPYPLMRACGVFVLSSISEGLPGVLIEALACGCPVVSTDCPGGAREILEDGRWGRLVPVGNAAAMADAISDVLDDPPPSAGPEALVRFRPEGAVEEYLALLEGHRHA